MLSNVFNLNHLVSLPRILLIFCQDPGCLCPPMSVDSDVKVELSKIITLSSTSQENHYLVLYLDFLFIYLFILEKKVKLVSKENQKKPPLWVAISDPLLPYYKAKKKRKLCCPLRPTIQQRKNI